MSPGGSSGTWRCTAGWARCARGRRCCRSPSSPRCRPERVCWAGSYSVWWTTCSGTPWQGRSPRCSSVPLSSASRRSPASCSPASPNSGNPWPRSGPGWGADEPAGLPGAATGAVPHRTDERDRGSAASMTSTIIGLPDRYRPLDEVGPEEQTPTGVIRCWRAKDRVLNRDVAIRVHTPSGTAAHAWITRALTAGGLATPALAMVYDASEGVGDPQAPGGAAYVVNEWIDGETLSERLTRGPLPDREVRTVLRRLAEGVAEAHRVGLAVGGLTPDNVVLRPNGLVGLRAVPAATGSIDGDIAALGALLE